MTEAAPQDTEGRQIEHFAFPDPVAAIHRALTEPHTAPQEPERPQTPHAPDSPAQAAYSPQEEP